MGNVHDKPDRKDAPLASVMHSVSYVRLLLRSVQVLLPKRSNYRLGCVGYNGFSSFQRVVDLLKGPWVLCSKRRSYWVKAAIYLKMDNFSNYTCFLSKLKTAELANARTVNDLSYWEIIKQRFVKCVNQIRMSQYLFAYLRVILPVIHVQFQLLTVF